MNKKLLLAATFAMCSNFLTAQVLYSENFDNLTIGNVSTDLTGQTPGKGNWYTITSGTTAPANAGDWFQIQNETNKGKVITIQSVPLNIISVSSIQQRNIDVLINNRTTGNNVIKLELDFYTGSLVTNSPILPKIFFGFTDRNDAIYSITKPIGSLSFLADTGELEARHLSSNSSIKIKKLKPNNQPLFLPFNTWVKLAIYLDYPNKKIYYEIPSLNTIYKDDFLELDNDPNYFTKYTPKSIQAFNNVEGAVIATYKFDNIKITALNNVPLNVSEFLNDKFNIFPNPATNIVYITNTDNILIDKILVYDVSGKLVKEEIYTTETDIQLNVESLHSGIYLLKLETKHGTAIKKMIKQ
ncbi:T9SS type A sorting domain-containing protein [Paenimyroides aestuarii]|uniref:T9SS type A sorting domain-containing protein n=1 Tax=Paenimyroides aestuarii TaxID=2968490 RepID=A0ABY5NV45_9FLAO|nr:T9SS type A sorting domain-containing protein [Paenimyroides aestuarii]UUV22471.1 T9SS type A sorting domain-containing protein [Paenimyroides aestuarii]